MAKIRKAKATDLASLIELENTLFHPPFSYENLEKEVSDNEFSSVYVVEEGPIFLGFSILWILFEQAQVVQIGVDKAFQNRGYGKSLMKKMIDDAKKNGCEVMSLEVRVSNIPARSFYETFGFRQAALRRLYYRDPVEDGILLWRAL